MDIPLGLSQKINLAAILNGPLDVYSGNYALYGARRILSTYRGPLYTVRRESDNATYDVYATASAADGWPSLPNLLAFAGGAVLYVSAIYDQSGSARHLTQATTTKQPMLNTDGPYGLFDFDGQTQEIPATTALAAFSQNSTGLTIIAVRKHDVATKNDRAVFFCNGGTSATRILFGAQSATQADTVSGRRNDTDNNQRSPGLPLNKNWATEVVRIDYTNAKLTHQRGSATGTETEVVNPFQTAGAAGSAASNNVSIGSTNGASFLNGKIAAIALVSRVLMDNEVASLLPAFSSTQIAVPTPNNFLSWGDTLISGTYTALPNASNVVIAAPDGTTPTGAALTSHRYHNHTCIAVSPNIPSRLWAAASSGLNGEDTSGQLSVAYTSADGGASWSAPMAACPSQSTPGDAYDPNARIVWSRGFVPYGGKIYLASAVQSGDFKTGLALVANECRDDGTIGPPFLVSTVAYAPLSGFAALTYDPVLGPPILAYSALYGIWGGSMNNGTMPSVWPQWTYQGGAAFTEPCTIKLDATGTKLQRLWRKTSGQMLGWFWSQLSSDGGNTWSLLSVSDIPTSPSPGCNLRLSDGRIVLVNNSKDLVSIRDTLVLSLFNSAGVILSTYGVQQGVTAAPTYPFAGKNNGAQYPGVAFDGTNMLVTYALQKERVGFTKVPLSGL